MNNQEWEPPEENYPYVKWPMNGNHIIRFSDAKTKEKREACNELIGAQNNLLDMMEDVGWIDG